MSKMKVLYQIFLAGIFFSLTFSNPKLIEAKEMVKVSSNCVLAITIAMKDFESLFDQQKEENKEEKRTFIEFYSGQHGKILCVGTDSEKDIEVLIYPKLTTTRGGGRSYKIDIKNFRVVETMLGW